MKDILLSWSEGLAHAEGVSYIAGKHRRFSHAKMKLDFTSSNVSDQLVLSLSTVTLDT